MLSNFRLALRQLTKSPVFSLTVVAALAIGIGATTAIYSVVDHVLLRPLTFPHPETLVSINESIAGSAIPVWPASARHFTEWQQRSTSFAHLAAIAPGAANLTGNGEPERLEAIRVSSSWCQTMGVQPALGRGFLPGEDLEGKNHVVLLTDQLWRRRFNADPAVVGSSIRIDDEPCTVIGVLPRSFLFPGAHSFFSYYSSRAAPELIRPLTFSADELRELMGRFNYAVIARLKPTATIGSATTELNGIAVELVKAAGAKADLRAIVEPLQETIAGKSRSGLLLVLGAVGCVLLIICVNLANLLLVRAEKQASDLAVRVALGASRWQLLVQALTETLVLAFTGGLLGVGLAMVGLQALTHRAPADIPRLAEVQLDYGVIGFAFALTLVAGLGFGLAPAWRTATVDPHEALKSGGRMMGGTARGRRLRDTLVAAEVGLSTILLVLAALLLISFGRLLRTDQGFTAPTVLTADVGIPWAKYKEPAQRSAFYQRLLAELGGTPGVTSVGISNALPLQGQVWIDSVSSVGDTTPHFQRPTANIRFVSADYFVTMGVPFLGGRTFNDADRDRAPAIISRQLAATLWPGQDALGREITSGGGTLRVIGIVGDVRAELSRTAPAIVYRPYWEWPQSHALVAARALGDPRLIAEGFRRAIRAVDQDVPIPELRTMADIRDESVAQRRFQMSLATAFALTSLLVAALGIYAVVAYTVARRTQEMAIRSALGAEPLRLLLLVVRQGLGPIALGLTIGLAGACIAGRLVSGLLYETAPYDLAAMSSVTGILLFVGVVACLVPAARATRANPVDALRAE